MGVVKHDSDLQTPAGQEGVSDLLEDSSPTERQTLDRLAFQKALDDIAANESAGYNFSVKVLKDHFSRGVQLLADNELHPALPEQAFPVVKQQTSQFVAGNLISPEYRTSRALDLALLPTGDPVLREATPATIATIGLSEVKQYFAATFRPDLTTIVVIGDVSPEGSQGGDREVVWRLESNRPQAQHHLASGPVESNLRHRMFPILKPIQDSVDLARAIESQPFRPGLLSLATGQSCAGWRLLRDSSLP